MQLHVLRADHNFGARNAAREGLVERRLRSFRPDIQPAVRSLARRHSRLADLAVTFPALLVALAVPRAGIDARPVIGQAIAGMPLTALSMAAGVPLWLRRFPPAYFSQTIPTLPDNHDFRRRIANHLPRSAKRAPMWLAAVANSSGWCNEPLAIWVARNLVQNPEHVPLHRLRLVCLWAWFSGRPDAFAHRFIERPWNSEMLFATAVDAANHWHTAIDLYAELGDQTIGDMWAQPGSADGYEFVPLRSRAELDEEARTMRNCVRTYGHALAHNNSRLWSIQKDGRRIATLELSCSGRDPLPNVFGLKAAGNKDVSIEVSLAARRWLHAQDLARMNIKPLEGDAVPLNRTTWTTLWKPYWIAKRRIPDWLPLKPSRHALADL